MNSIRSEVLHGRSTKIFCSSRCEQQPIFGVVVYINYMFLCDEITQEFTAGRRQLFWLQLSGGAAQCSALQPVMPTAVPEHTPNPWLQLADAATSRFFNATIVIVIEMWVTAQPCDRAPSLARLPGDRRRGGAQGPQSPASPATAANEAARKARIISQHTLPAAGQAQDPVLASLPHFKHPRCPLSLKNNKKNPKPAACCLYIKHAAGLSTKIIVWVKQLRQQVTVSHN